MSQRETKKPDVKHIRLFECSCEEPPKFCFIERIRLTSFGKIHSPYKEPPGKSREQLSLSVAAGVISIEEQRQVARSTRDKELLLGR